MTVCARTPDVTDRDGADPPSGAPAAVIVDDARAGVLDELLASVR